jgi:hypothetical protein
MHTLSAAWLYPLILIAGARQAWGPPIIWHILGRALMTGGIVLIALF